MWRLVNTANFIGRVPVQRLMNPIPVVVLPEVHEFSLKVLNIPKEDVIKVFTANGTDESLDEGMRAGCIGNAFDFVDIQDAEIRLPALIPEQRVIIRTEVVWDTLGRNGLVEHAT